MRTTNKPSAPAVSSAPLARGGSREDSLRTRSADRDAEFERLFGRPGAGGARAPELIAGARSRAPGFEVGGMDLGRAAELAVTRRLKIVVRSADPEAARRRAGFTVERPQAQNGPGRGADEQPEPADAAVALNFAMDPELLGLQDALARVAESLLVDGEGEVLFEEVAEGAPDDDATVQPSTEVSDVLWWTRPTDLWAVRSQVVLPIQFEQSVPEP